MRKKRRRRNGKEKGEKGKGKRKEKREEKGNEKEKAKEKKGERKGEGERERERKREGEREDVIRRSKERKIRKTSSVVRNRRLNIRESNLKNLATINSPCRRVCVPFEVCG